MADIQLSALINKFLQETSTSASEKNTLRGYLGASAMPSWPKIAYVETTGNNSTAVIGDPMLPFLTPQAAYNAILAAAAGQYVIRCGAGSFGGITLASGGTGTLVGIYGVAGFSFISGITGAGSNGTAGGLDESGTAGTNGINLILFSDKSISLGTINLNGGNGGDGGPVDIADTYGGAGGNGAEVTFVNVRATSLSASGGNGGIAPEAGTSQGGAGGEPGRLDLKDCEIGTITAIGGTPGTGMIAGSAPTLTVAHTIGNLICATEIAVSSDGISGAYAHGYAASKTLTGVVDALLPV